MIPRGPGSIFMYTYVEVEESYWSDVRQELSVQGGYKTGHGRAYMEQNVEQLERRRGGNCTQLKCACCGGQEERRD